MSGTIPKVDAGYIKLHDVVQIDTLGSSARDTPKGYILLQNDKGGTTAYRFEWNGTDGVMYLWRVQSDGSDEPTRRAIAITDNLKQGDQVKMRNASRKEGKAPFMPHGVFKVGVACNERLSSLNEVKGVLEYYGDVAPDPAVTLENTVTPAMLTTGDSFYPVLSERVFHYLIDPDTKLKMLEELEPTGTGFKKRRYLQDDPDVDKESFVKRTADARWQPIGPFLTIIRSTKPLTYAKAREYLAMYKNGMRVG